MSKPKQRQMVQWAPGSKMQRFSRVEDDTRYWRNFKAAQRNEKRGVPKNFKVDMICQGDALYVQGVITRAGEVDYEAKTVMIGPHRHGFSAVKRLPMWMDGALHLMEQDVKNVDFDYRCPVIAVKLEPHPNATELSIVNCFGYPVVVQTQEFKGKDKAVFIPADSRILNNDPYYDWLGRDKRRIRIRKFRGIKSYGILVPLNEGYGIGTDLQEIIQVCHYKSKAPRNKVNGNQQPDRK